MANTDDMAVYDGISPAEGLGTAGLLAASAAGTKVGYGKIKKALSASDALARSQADAWLVGDDKLRLLREDMATKFSDLNKLSPNIKDGDTLSSAEDAVKKAKAEYKASAKAMHKPGPSDPILVQATAEARKRLAEAKVYAADVKEYTNAKADYDNSKFSYDGASEKRKLKDLYEANPTKNANKIKKQFTKESAFLQTKAGKKYISNEAAAKRARAKDFVDLEPKKGKFPTKKVAGLAGLAGTSALAGEQIFGAMGSWGENLGNFAHSAADALPEDSSLNNVLNGVGYAGDGWKGAMDIAGLSPGVVTGLAAGGAAAKYSTDNIKNRYNLLNDPDGMTRTQAVGQGYRDSDEALKDKYAKTKNKLGRGVGAVGNMGGLLESNFDRGERLAKQQTFDTEMQDRADKRWKDPRYEEFVRRNTGLTARGDAGLSAAEQVAATKERVAKMKDTGRRQYIKDRLNEDIDFRKNELWNVEAELDKQPRTPMDAKGRAYAAKLKGQAAGLKSELKKLKVELDVDLDKLFTDEDILDSKKFHRYTKNSGRFKNGERMASAVKAWDKTRAGITAAATAAGGAAQPVVEEGVEKAKGLWESAKDVAAKAKQKAGLSSAPVSPEGAALSEGGVIPPDEVPKKGLLRRGAGAVVNNPLTRGVSKGLTPNMLLWEGPRLVNELYNSDDKEKYLKETGASMWDALSEEAKEYKTMLSNGDIDDAILKFGKEILIPEVIEGGKAAYNIGALGVNAASRAMGGDDFAPIASKEDRGKFTTIKGSMAEGGFHGDKSKYDENNWDYNYDPNVKNELFSGVPTTQSERSLGPSAPGGEQSEVDKRKMADAYNAINKQQRASAEAAARDKFGGYLNAQDYARQYGAKAITAGDSRYGNTPIYSNQAGNSFSDTPTGMFGSKYEGTIDDTKAKGLRDNYVKTEKAVRDQMRRSAMPAWAVAGGFTPDEFLRMTPTEKSEGYKAYGVVSKNKADMDRVASLETQKAFAAGGQESEAMRNHLAARIANNTATKSEFNSFNTNEYDRNRSGGVGIPLMDKGSRYTYRPGEDIPGVLMDDNNPDINAIVNTYAVNNNI